MDTLRPRKDQKKQTPAALALSVVLHLIAGAVLLRVVTLGISASQLGKIREKTVPIPGERLQYIRVAPGPSIVPRQPEPASTAPAAAPPPAGPKALVAPTEIPQGVAAPVSRDTGSTMAGATGSGASSGGAGAGGPAAARGVTPAFGDARLWGVPSPGAGVARSGTDNIDSVIVATLRSARDSADSASRHQKPGGDWTKTDANGGKWGWDQTGIRLGKVTIPNALLGLLPLNAQRGLNGNPLERERNTRLAMMRDEILRNAARAAGEDDFKKAVKAVRARKDRERAERIRLAAATQGRESPPPPSVPPRAEPDR
ncbi:MAG: hypothetical protein MUE41_11490 [Gemmatimonadaceae bacterium]|jgi:hypothetical protein|nr:hypothetical protein [Gemmatimonadaceae bacterium]